MPLFRWKTVSRTVWCCS